MDFQKTVATKLIKQLPKDLKERNDWLVNNSDCEESKELRVKIILGETHTSPEEKLERIMNIFISKDNCSQPAMPAYRPGPPIGPGPQSPKW